MEGKNALLDKIINPGFLELINQPLEDFSFSTSLSLDLKIRRGGRDFIVSISTWKDSLGRVTVSQCQPGKQMDRIVLSDYCHDPNDFVQMIRRLDEMIPRMPVNDQA